MGAPWLGSRRDNFPDNGISFVLQSKYFFPKTRHSFPWGPSVTDGGYRNMSVQRSPVRTECDPVPRCACGSRAEPTYPNAVEALPVGVHPSVT